MDKSLRMEVWLAASSRSMQSAAMRWLMLALLCVFLGGSLAIAILFLMLWDDLWWVWRWVLEIGAIFAWFLVSILMFKPAMLHLARPHIRAYLTSGS